MRGLKRGGSSRWGIDLFIEDGAYTTVGSAVAILMVLALLLSASLAVWTSSRASDVQPSADATALAGANVVSSYHTAATVVDASVLSMGLAGFTMAGVGLVGLLVPGAHAAAAKTIDAGVRMIKLRNQFASSASKGLKQLETSLPYLVAANATRTCVAQDTERVSYAGTALADPRTSASEFPALEGDGVATDALEGASGELDQAAQDLAEAAQRTAQAKERAWLADCGREGMNMQERAGKLSGISDVDNPDFASSLTWDPQVALARTRAYYRWRLEHNAAEGSGVEAQADAAARRAFYAYALDRFERASVAEVDGRIVSTVELLPKNTEEVRATALYTDAVWPSTAEIDGLTLHYGADCPGATGGAGPMLAVSSIETGQARECSTCRFGVGDLGKAPAASTSIDNGFEYHLRTFTLALNEYVDARNAELELERAAQGKAEQAADAFDEAISALANKRPRIAPPGRYGCVAIVAAGELAPSGELDTPFAAGDEVPARGAVSAAALAPDAATRENNVLASFFSSVEERVGTDGPAGLVDSVMDLWGDLLVSYGDAAEGLGGVTDGLLEGLDSIGAGPVARWLGDRIAGVMKGLGLEPVDLSLRKPVLTDTSRVLSRSGADGLASVQDMLRSIPAGATDPAAILEAVGYEVGNYLTSLEFTVAEIPLPTGGSIPLTIRLRDLVGAGGDGR